MNAKPWIFVIVLLTAGRAYAADDHVRVDELPPAVHKALEPWRAHGPVKQVTRTVEDGRVVYTIQIERNNAPNPHVRIAEDGTVVRDPMLPYVSLGDMPLVVPAPNGPDSPRMQVSELPAAVQTVVRQEANGREIADIDREVWNGRAVFEVEFKERGPNSRIYVAEDGTLIREEHPRPTTGVWFIGTRLEDTPREVQDTVRRLAGDREITDIDRKRNGADVVYRVEIRGPQGAQELRLAPDGTILYDSRGEDVKRRRG